MGKRELLLVFCFVVVGVVVYQTTARPPAPGERGLSISRLIESARREIRGNRANAEDTRTAAHAIAPEVTELRVVGALFEIEVAGENRADVETTTHVESNGYDVAEAQELVKQSKLIADRTETSLILRMEYPRGGRQRGTIRIKVPTRLQVRVEPGPPGVLKVSDVASLEIAGTRGETVVRRISGRAEISHRGGEVDVEDVGSLELTGRAGEVKVANVRGDASIRLEQGGEMVASGIAGALEVDARNCDVRLNDLSTSKGPVRVNLNGGSLKLAGLRSDTRIDSRGAEIEVSMAAPAPLAIFANGERVTLTPPSAGYTLDARVIEGRITPDDFIKAMGFTSTTATDNREARVYGPFKGGGPTISVRASNADFTIHEHGQKSETDVEAPATVKPKLKSTLK
jgi:hypothetical protein